MAFELLKTLIEVAWYFLVRGELLHAGLGYFNDIIPKFGVVRHRDLQVTELWEA